MAKTPKPWYRKSHRTWYATLEGVQHPLGKDKKAAQDRFFELMRTPRERRSVSPHSLPAIIDAFLEWVHIHRAPDTYEWYRYRLQRFIERYPDLAVGELRPFHAQRWVDSYPDFSKTTRRNYLRSIKRCLGWALGQGYIEHNPLQHMEVPSADRRDVLVTEDEYQHILTFIRDDSFRDVVEVTWETGCRPQESLFVEARHVDVKNHRWVFNPSESKGERWPRIVYLNDQAMHLTRRLMLKHREGPLFRNINGRPWSSDSVNCGFDRIQIRMGKQMMTEQEIVISLDDIKAFIPTLQPKRIQRGVEIAKTPAELREEAKRKLTQKRAVRVAKRYCLYALRHSWATHALQTGLDGLTVAVLLGHADVSTLARVYQHLAHNPEHLLQQAKRVRSTG